MAKVISISLGPKHQERLKGLCDHFGVGNSEMVRRMIDDSFSSITKGGPRTEAPSRIAKRNREEAFDNFKRMAPDKMTVELTRIGYIIPGERHPVTEVEIIQYVDFYDGKLCLITSQGGSTASNPMENLYGEIEDLYRKFYAKAENITTL